MNTDAAIRERRLCDDVDVRDEASKSVAELLSFGQTIGETIRLINLNLTVHPKDLFELDVTEAMKSDELHLLFDQLLLAKCTQTVDPSIKGLCECNHRLTLATDKLFAE